MSIRHKQPKGLGIVYVVGVGNLTRNRSGWSAYLQVKEQVQKQELNSIESSSNLSDPSIHRIREGERLRIKERQEKKG